MTVRHWYVAAGEDAVKYSNMAANFTKKEAKMKIKNMFLNNKFRWLSSSIKKKKKKQRGDKREGWGQTGGESQRWRQWPEKSMPIPRSHFLLHRRLLWNSSSVVDITMKVRWKRERERESEYGTSNISHASLHFLLHTVPFPLSCHSEAKQKRYVHSVPEV